MDGGPREPYDLITAGRVRYSADIASSLILGASRRLAGNLVLSHGRVDYSVSQRLHGNLQKES